MPVASETTSAIRRTPGQTDADLTNAKTSASSRALGFGTEDLGDGLLMAPYFPRMTSGDKAVAKSNCDGCALDRPDAVIVRKRLPFHLSALSP